jgi:2-C-methyl-D-erythritol 4-phosphate cytidylyltransferase
MQKGSAIPGITPRDTIKRISTDSVEQTLDRSKLILVQTPQFFNSTIYNAALQQINENQLYTDDASIVESAGYNVYWVEGERDNIKITYAEDLHLAKNKLLV